MDNKSIEEKINDLDAKISARTTRPLRINHLPTSPGQIGYILTKSIPVVLFSPDYLENNTAKTIVSLTLPSKGVWLISCDLNFTNPGISINGDDIINTIITDRIMSVTLGETINLQSVPVVLYNQDLDEKILTPGSSFRFHETGVYVANAELTLSFNCLFSFTGRNVYISSNYGSLVLPYNLIATRIG